ncbi:unnamed protein product [Rangifer tarandus platyrhynchus]|uniref:Uncharacterized protein n=1 Tax=Rangifer tarandus platyrhynchus TaxID=3082113 RepID=A0ABN8ZU32_RANTA|nr:unnamed protein product [Rangifer tarandus platyrhynchus]
MVTCTSMEKLKPKTLGDSLQGPWGFSALTYTLAFLGEGRWDSEEGQLLIPRAGTLSGSTGCQLPLTLAVAVGVRRVHEHPRWAGAPPEALCLTPTLSPLPSQRLPRPFCWSVSRSARS